MIKNDQAESLNVRSYWLTELLDWLKFILLAVLIGLFLALFVIQRNSVIGSSMIPTLRQDDQLLVEKVSRWFGGVQHGDIVTINPHSLPHHDEGPNIIKRVIALPGDTVEIGEDGVYLNGLKLQEDYLPAETVTEVRDPKYRLLTLGEDEYFVLGDNRTVSLDSRIFGPVQFSDIIGEVLIRVYPLNELGAP